MYTLELARAWSLSSCRLIHVWVQTDVSLMVDGAMYPDPGHCSHMDHCIIVTAACLQWGTLHRCGEGQGLMTDLYQQFCEWESLEYCAALIITGSVQWSRHSSVKQSVASQKTWMWSELTRRCEAAGRICLDTDMLSGICSVLAFCVTRSSWILLSLDSEWQNCV